MYRLPPPPGLNLTGNLAENWRRFEQQYDVYAVASGVASKADKVQGMTLLHVLGPDAIDVYNTSHGQKMKIRLKWQISRRNSRNIVILGKM